MVSTFFFKGEKPFSDHTVFVRWKNLKNGRKLNFISKIQTIIIIDSLSSFKFIWVTKVDMEIGKIQSIVIEHSVHQMKSAPC